MALKHSLVALLVISGLSACSSSPDELEVEIEEKTSIQSAYEKAQSLIENGSFFPAAELLAELDSRYPFGPHAHQVQLDLIYTYYKMGQSAQALASVDRFIRLNSTHSNIDYVHYMRGLINIQLSRNEFQEAFGIERFDRDITPIKDAFMDFRTVVVNHPDSNYAADAKQRMVYLKDYMAKSELAAAQYYIDRGAFAAAANRAQHVVEAFQDSQQLERALEIMVMSYDELKLTDLKKNALATLKLNFPDNSLARAN